MRFDSYNNLRNVPADTGANNQATDAATSLVVDARGSAAKATVPKEKVVHAAEQKAPAENTWQPTSRKDDPNNPWFKQSDERMQKRFEAKDGSKYTVVHADSSEGIAARWLKSHDVDIKDVNDPRVGKAWAEFVKANKIEFPSLARQDATKEFLGDGWKLKVPQFKKDHYTEAAKPANTATAELPTGVPRPIPVPYFQDIQEGSRPQVIPAVYTRPENSQQSFYPDSGMPSPMFDSNYGGVRPELIQAGIGGFGGRGFGSFGNVLGRLLGGLGGGFGGDGYGGGFGSGWGGRGFGGGSFVNRLMGLFSQFGGLFNRGGFGNGWGGGNYPGYDNYSDYDQYTRNQFYRNQYDYPYDQDQGYYDNPVPRSYVAPRARNPFTRKGIFG